MPRALPWDDTPAKPAKQQKLASSVPRKPPHHSSSDSEDLVDSNLNPLRPTTPPPRNKKPKHRPARSPSSSPPPAPPDVEFMREGYNADDVYRMVEDEFNSTAQSYTHHIHRAEYERLKKLARSRGAEALGQMARATDGRARQGEELKLRVEAEGMARKWKAGEGKEETESAGEEEEDDYMRDAQLAGLMTGELRGGRDLLRMGNAQPKTRAAAGFAQSPRNVERVRDVLGVDAVAVNRKMGLGSAGKGVVGGDDDESDLDAPIGKGIRSTCMKTEKRDTEPANAVTKQANGLLGSGGSSIFKQFAKPTEGVKPQAPGKPAAKKEVVMKLSPSNSTTKTNGTWTTSKDAEPTKDSTREWLAKRRADKEKRQREKNRKAKAVDDIPTFLF